MEMPSTYELHNLTERGKTFECPSKVIDKELKWQQIRLVITEMQEATAKGEYSIQYVFPEEVLDNTKVVKSVSKFFLDQKYEVHHDVKSYDKGKYMSISWSHEFYRYHD